MQTFRLLICAVLFSASLFGQSAKNKQQRCGAHFSERDRAAIKAVIEAYRTAWLRGDAAGVQRTLTDMSVLLPPHASEPVVGMKKIQEFWWPKDGPATKVLQLDIFVEQVEGNGCLAFARGTDTVGWSTFEGGNVSRTRHKGRYLNVMKKMADGSWRILQHMWDDQPSESF
jgi:ketosteroid isomerase-like protein